MFASHSTILILNASTSVKVSRRNLSKELLRLCFDILFSDKMKSNKRDNSLSDQPHYKARLDKRFMSFVALQPLVVDEAFMPFMRAIDVPFHLLHS